MIPREALLAWEKILGAKYVLTDKNTIQEVSSATFVTQQEVLAVLQPKTRDEVKRCVEIANHWRIPLHPISTGMNLGYGSKVPVVNGSVILELKRLDAIIDYSEKFGYITIQPGVTFEKVKNYLDKRKSTLMLSVGVQPLNGSVIGNITEKGFGKGIAPDLYNNMCGLGVILADGRYIKTDFTKFSNSSTMALSNTAPGPSLNGLFLQSNFGIITEATIWLHKKPKHFALYCFSISDDRRLKLLIEKLRVLKMDGIVQGNSMIFNAYKALPDFRGYPWKEMNGKTPLSISVLKKVGGQYGIRHKWMGSLPIYGTNESHLQLLYDEIDKTLSEYTAEHTYLDNSGEILKSNWENLRKDKLILKKHWRVHVTKTPYLGYISKDSLDRIRWRKRRKIISEREAEIVCGVLFANAVVPFDGNSIDKVVKIIESIFLFYGFEPMISINFFTEREVYIIAELLYDKENSQEDKNAKNCYTKTFHTLINNGFYPYRLPIFALNWLEMGIGEQELLKKLKSLFDPNNILSPGRYI